MSKLKDRIPVCPHGSRESINQMLVFALERLERELGYKLYYNSGYRCEECNAAAGGKPNSAHLLGRAVDIRVANSAERYHLMLCALRLNFTRIGIGPNFVHLDVDLDLPQHVVWLY